MDDSITKRCTKCGVESPRASFNSAKNRPDGLYPQCKKCAAQSHRDWIAAHPDRRKDQKHRERTKNKERYQSFLQAYYKEHQDAIKASSLVNTHARRARKQNTPGQFTPLQWNALRAWFGNVCLNCGSSEHIAVDHVIPLTKGGSNDIANLQPLCRSCNATKHNKVTDYRDPERLRLFLAQLKKPSPLV